MAFYHLLGKKKFYLHLLAAVVLFVLIIWIVLSMLDNYTRHGEVYVVPDFVGKDHQEIITRYESQFQFIISDSLYKNGAMYSSVLQQDPLPGSKVKKGRNIYFIIVARQPEKVRMPNLLNLSLRQALVTLESAGLKVNELSFVDHFARNAIVEQLYDGVPIEPETLLFRGSDVNLVLGNGGSLLKTPFPMIYGKKPADAHFLLHSSTFNVGNEHFLDDADSVNARVYKIEPYIKPGNEIMPGTFISIWYRSDNVIDFESFMKDSLYIEAPQTDSLNFENFE
ncbi:MAG: hypothetical protein Q8T08_18695 [Ignavibacteria bacterium]|nr:hypothetical protein [Ignavibacteria bacterium]